MRHRATFLAGLAIGLVAGARAGRERYEQLKRLSQKVAGSPAVRQVTRAASEKATELTKAAGHQAAERLPKISETARSGADRVRSQFGRVHEQDEDGEGSAGAGETTSVNGIRPG